jgi:hypothetical protein
MNLHFRAGFFLQMFDVQTGDHHKEDLDKFGYEPDIQK